MSCSGEFTCILPLVLLPHASVTDGSYCLVLLSSLLLCLLLPFHIHSSCWQKNTPRLTPRVLKPKCGPEWVCCIKWHSPRAGAGAGPCWCWCWCWCWCSVLGVGRSAEELLELCEDEEEPGCASLRPCPSSRANPGALSMGEGVARQGQGRGQDWEVYTHTLYNKVILVL